MVDHVRTLLVNPPTGGGYVHVSDEPADAVMGMVGLTGTYLDAALVDRVMSLAMAPDLEWARDVFDQRVTPPRSSFEQDRYDVYVDPNGGYGGESDVKSYPAEHEDLEIRLTRPSHDSLSFAGWMLSSPSLALSEEDTIVVPKGFSGDIVAQATWGQEVQDD